MNNMNKMIVIVAALVILPCATVLGEENELEAAWNAVAAKYPTREELLQRVEAYKSEHAAEFAAAKADFELAVRSMVSLEFPLSPDDLRRHVIPKPKPMPPLRKRDSLQEAINSLSAQDSPIAQGCAEFWEGHFEEVVVNQTPAHRYVYLDCLLNGWSEWSQWTTPKLMGVREKHPDVYLKYALDEMAPMRSEEDYALHKDFLPTLLQVMGDQSFSIETRYRAELKVRRLAGPEKDQDIMKYCVLKYLDTHDQIHLSVSGAVDERLPAETRRAFWQPYLEHQEEFIRLVAVDKIGDTIRKPRPGEDPRPEDAALADRLREILQTDPSPQVKKTADYKLRLYDKSDTRPTHGRSGGPPSP